MYLCSGRETVSVRKLKSHPRIVFVSDNPPSAFNLSSATIFSRGIGSLGSLGRAATSIARGIAAAILSMFFEPGMLTVSPQLCCQCKRLLFPLGRRECQLSVLSPLRRECRRREIVGGGCLFGPKHVSLLDPSRCIAPAHLLNRILILK